MIIEIRDIPEGSIANITVDIKFHDGNPQINSKISPHESLTELKTSLFTDENLNQIDEDYEEGISDLISDEDKEIFDDIEKSHSDKPEIPDEMQNGTF